MIERAPSFSMTTVSMAERIDQSFAMISVRSRSNGSKSELGRAFATCSAALTIGS
ncbi:hypothetical protein D3C87_2114290 [compost metagenome]